MFGFKSIGSTVEQLLDQIPHLLSDGSWKTQFTCIPLVPDRE